MLVDHPTEFEILATGSFGLALIHTFSVKKLQHLSRKFRTGSLEASCLHLLGEVEIAFALWAAILLILMGFIEGSEKVVSYLASESFVEPAFVFVIMAICATRPITRFAEGVIDVLSRFLPFKRPLAFYCTTLIIGPIFGSFITEPAAMTVTAMILLDRFYTRGPSQRFKYATLGLLFVNVSIGGTLTPYAAPPVLMVADSWHWDLAFMLAHFGWKAVISIGLSTAIVAIRFKKELDQMHWGSPKAKSEARLPIWVLLVNLALLLGVVVSSRQFVVFSGLFAAFLVFFKISQKYQNGTRLREAFLVALFLSGLVILGDPQDWWLSPILTRLNSTILFIGSTALTAITDNAALTFLGSQVENLSESSRYLLVAGAVAGGGLTVIANAPNPAGFGILNSSFGKEGISPLQLFTNALVPTVIAMGLFWIL